MPIVRMLRRIATWLLAVSAAQGTAPKIKMPADEDGTSSPEKKDPVKSDSAGPPRDVLIDGIQRVRATSRWIVAGFAAVAGVVVGTAPLDKIDEIDVDSAEVWVAGIGLLAVVVGIWRVIGAAAAVDAPVGLSPEELKLAERSNAEGAPTPVPPSLANEHDEIRVAAAWIADADLVDVRPVEGADPPERYIAPGPRPITYLANARDTARDQWLHGRLRVEGATTAAQRKACEEANAGRATRLKRLDDELTYVMTLANYFRINRRFEQRRSRIMTGAVLAGLGIIAFRFAAYIDDPPPTGVRLQGVALTRAVGVDLSNASLAGAQLTGADLRDAKLGSADLTAAKLMNANLAGADLTGANLSAANLEGADGLTPTDVADATWIGATCPDGTTMDAVADTCATETRLDGS